MILEKISSKLNLKKNIYGLTWCWRQVWSLDKSGNMGVQGYKERGGRGRRGEDKGFEDNLREQDG